MRSKARLAAPVLLAHAEVTKKIILFSMGPKLRYPTVVKFRRIPTQVLWCCRLEGAFMRFITAGEPESVAVHADLIAIGTTSFVSIQIHKYTTGALLR
jgi:hypothetical protein